MGLLIFLAACVIRQSLEWDWTIHTNLYAALNDVQAPTTPTSILPMVNGVRILRRRTAGF